MVIKCSVNMAAGWIGDVLRHDCLLKTVLEGKMDKENGHGENQEERRWTYSWSKRTRRSVTRS